MVEKSESRANETSSSVTDQPPEESSPQVYAERLRRSYFNFRWPLFLLAPEEYTQPRLESGWTPLAMVAHVAYWDSFQLRRMEAAVRGGGPISSPSASNDERAASENRSWEDVLAAADAAREQMIEFALSLTGEQIEADYGEGDDRGPLVKRLLTHMPRHVDEHAEEVHRYCFSLERWGRERVFKFYRRQFNNLLDSITGLTEDSCVSIPVCGVWSVRDILAHALVWDEYAWEMIRQWPEVDLTHLAPWIDDDDDTVNDRLMAHKADLSMIDLLDRLATVHRRIVRGCRKLSDAKLQTEVTLNRQEEGNAIYLLISMSAHTADHASEIYAARAEGRLVPLK